ncbi:MAG: methyltransferase domain-containing protein [Thermofilum sp.]|jgi:tRNA (guanine10-N2)-dimethyltransferase|nr:methyltransferase domain-containing protein [Thermofilum sp.]
MPVIYLEVSRCLDACGLGEVVKLAEEYCGCRVLRVYEDLVKLSCESEEVAMLCALRANCVRKAVREVAVLPWSIADDSLFEEISAEVANIASSLKKDDNLLRLCIEFYDPQSTFHVDLRENVIKAAILRLRKKGIHAVFSRSLPDLTAWIGALDSIVLGVKLQSVKGDRFEPRAPGRRVYERPFALRVELARLLVNLSSPSLESPLLDPFCGTGGILIEAALEGVFAVGIDLDYDNVRGARRNALQLGIYHGVDIVLSDSELMPFRDKAFAAAAFDPPYGRAASSMGRDPAFVLARVLDELKRVLKEKGRAAFLAPKSEEYSFLKSSASRICSIYVHGSLTREVWLVEERR